MCLRFDEIGTTQRVVNTRGDTESVLPFTEHMLSMRQLLLVSFVKWG